MKTFNLDDNKLAVECEPSEVQWDIEKRRVAKTTIGDFWISTVFLAHDHQWNDGSLPLLFETMITKNGVWLDYQERCSTWNQAVLQHQVACHRVETGEEIK